MDLFLVTIVFIILSPGFLYKLPTKESYYIILFCHAILFYIILYFTKLSLKEGFYNTQQTTITFSKNNLPPINGTIALKDGLPEFTLLNPLTQPGEYMITVQAGPNGYTNIGSVIFPPGINIPSDLIKIRPNKQE